MKSLKLLHAKDAIYCATGQNLLTSVDTKTNSSFHGTIARTKVNVFSEIFLAVFLFIRATVLECTSNVLHNMVFRTKIEQLKTTVSCFLWRRHGNEVTISFGYYYTVIFVIRFYLLTEDCRKTQNFKYQNLVFSFLTYVIIFLFRPMYLVIKCSFMNKSYIAKIFINIYIAYCIYRHTAHIGYSI